MPVNLPHIPVHGIIIKPAKIKKFCYTPIFYLKKNIIYQSESPIAPPKSEIRITAAKQAQTLKLKPLQPKFHLHFWVSGGVT